MSDEADRIRTYQELARRGQAVPGKNFGTGVTPKTKRIEPKVKVIDTTKMKQIKLLRLGGNVSKNKDKLSGVNMAMSLDSQSQKDLAQLMKRAKKPRKIRTKPVKLSAKSNSIQKPGAFGIQRNDIMKARFGGKVVQKMQSGGEKLSQAELEEAIRQIGEQGNVFGKGESLSPSQTKKIADKFEADFTKMFGKKYGGAIRKMRGGGLMEAIKKVQAKEMKAGGDVEKPKAKPKNFKKIVQKQKRDRAIADGDMTIGDFNEMTPSMMQDFYKDASKVKKMVLGGEAKPLVGGQKKLDKNKDGRISGDDFAMMKMGGKVEKYRGGGKVKGGKMGCRGMGAALRGGGYTIS